MQVFKLTVTETLFLSIEKWVEDNPTLKIVQLIRDDTNGDWILITTT